MFFEAINGLTIVLAITLVFATALAMHHSKDAYALLKENERLSRENAYLHLDRIEFLEDEILSWKHLYAPGNIAAIELNVHQLEDRLEAAIAAEESENARNR